MWGNPIQIIWNGVDDYAIADDLREAQIPDWPVGDSSGRWHYSEFDGQKVLFAKNNPQFGFMAVEVQESEIPRDDDGELDTEGLCVVPALVGYRYFREVKK